MLNHGYIYDLPTEGDSFFPSEYLTLFKTEALTPEQKNDILSKVPDIKFDTVNLLTFPSGIFKMEILMNIVCIEPVYTLSENNHLNKQLYVIYRYLLDTIHTMNLSQRLQKAIQFQIYLYHRKNIHTPFERTSLDCRKTILGRDLKCQDMAEQVYRVNLEAGVPKECVIFKISADIQGISVPGTGFGSTIENVVFDR